MNVVKTKDEKLGYKQSTNNNITVLSVWGVTSPSSHN